MKIPSPARSNRSLAGGFTLIELMIAMVLGMIVVGGALTIFSSNKETYLSTENLGRIEENGRLAFELMAREIREAGGNACAKNLHVANILNSPGSNWWSNWNDPIKGYGGTDTLGTPAFGTATGQRVSGTDAIELKSTYDSGVTLVNQPSAVDANFKLTDVSGFQTNDVVIVCDYRQATILQLTKITSSTVTVTHETGTGSPGNCSKGMGFPTVCGTPVTGNPYVFAPNAVIAKMHATRWYIGVNSRGGQSLYQSVETGGALVNQEIAEGVTGMQLQYLLQGASDYVSAASVGASNWKNVLAVRLNLTLQGRDKVGTNGAVLTRQVQHIVTLRNRAS